MKYIVLILVLLNTNVLAKNYFVDATIIGLEDGQAIEFQRQMGGIFTTIETLPVKDNNVVFTLNDYSKKGIYRVHTQFTNVDVIFDHQNIAFATTHKQGQKNIEIFHNSQNQDFYKVIASKTADLKRKYLINLTNLYNERNPFYQELIKQNNIAFENDLEKTRVQIIAENKPTNRLLVQKIHSDKEYQKLWIAYQNKQLIDIPMIFKNFEINEFAIYSNLLSKRLNLYIYIAGMEYTENKVQQKQQRLYAKNKLLEYFKDSKFFKEIQIILDSIEPSDET